MTTHHLSWADDWLKKPKNNYINGRFARGESSREWTNINPANETKVMSWTLPSQNQTEEAVQSAKKTFEQGLWQRLPMRDRAKKLLQLADIIRSHEEQFATLESIATGKTYKEALDDDLPDCSRIFEYYAGWIDKHYGENVPVEEGFINYTTREPIGVCALVVPWNFPLLMACWKIAPALATGNSICIKPSEHTPHTLIYLFELIHNKLDLPQGLINLLLGDKEVGETLSSHSDVDKISFTGSTQVGRSIVEQSARSNLKRVSLELGGKSPNIFFADTPNLQQAIDRSFQVMFSHKGEKCSEPTRFYIHESIYDKVVSSLVEKANQIVCGDPFSPNTHQGPQCHAEHFEKVLSYIEIGLAEGAKLLCGGRHDRSSNSDLGYFVRPTIFSEVTPSMRLSQEEIFGPILSVQRFSDEEEVISMANDSLYGLAAGLWTSDISRAHRVAHKLDAGMVFINRYGCYDFSSPFGGFKQSGWGKDMALHSLEEYSKTKSIWVKI